MEGPWVLDILLMFCGVLNHIVRLLGSYIKNKTYQHSINTTMQYTQHHFKAAELTFASTQKFDIMIAFKECVDYRNVRIHVLVSWSSFHLNTIIICPISLRACFFWHEHSSNISSWGSLRFLSKSENGTNSQVDRTLKHERWLSLRLSLNSALFAEPVS